jgi:signal transduction histidine kinase/DNA-binding response OmpR family regulator
MNASRDFLVGTGEMADLIRSTDWSATPLGSPETWPQSLRSAVSILLPSKAQITLFWGPELVTLYNDNYRPVLGKKHPRALGLPVREVWSEIWETGLRDLFEGVMRTGDAFWAEDRLFFLERHGYAEETFFDVSYDPVRDESGSVGGVFCIVSETTRRVLGERRLRALRDLAARNGNARSLDEACSLSVAAMSESAHDLTFVLLYLANPEGPPGFQCSTEGAAMLCDASHWPLEEAMRTNGILVVPLDEFAELPKGAWPRPPTQAAVVPVAASGTSARAGALVVGLNPFRPFDEEYRGFLELLSRQVAGALGSAQAFEHERKRAEALAALDHAKTTFFSNVSHEFRTPLTLLLGPIRDLVERSSGLTPDERATLGVAQRNGQRMLKLVNTLLEFSRIEAGRSQASYEPTDLATFTTDLASSFRSAVEKAGLRLVVDCPPLPEPAYVDRDMWEKIVLNLLSNALKFTFEGEIGVELRQNDGAFELSVRDTGTGIPSHEMPHLFERFWRVEGARSRTHEGTGIGLALVQELAKLHGGAVRVDSVEGKGSDFRVTFPVGKAHLPDERIGSRRTLVPKALGADPYVEEALRWLPDAEPTPLEFEPAPLRARDGTARRRRIVWADDNADMRNYVRRLLSPLYEVQAVSTGTAALAAVRANPPDLVLADVMMPELDGLALARSLRADPKTAAIPIVLLSAKAGEESRIEGLEAGADEYLYKPFSARELEARIESRLELARLQQRLDEDRERSLREEATTLAALNRVGKAVAGELDLDRIMQTVTDAATELSGAEFGAYFHNITNEAGESFLLYTLSGAPKEAFAKFGPPRNTAIFAPTFAGEGVVRLDDVTLDPRYGKNTPHQGMPKGHLPVKSYLAVPVIARSGRVMGGLFFGHSRPGVFSERSEVLVTGIASQAAVAAENAELHKQREHLIEKLRDADRRKDEFLATLSHELRNPLAPLRNSLHLLLMSSNGGEATEPLREMMERQVNHLVRLVDDLLEMSRISRGALELRKELVELAAIVQNAVETSDPLLTSARHELRVSLPQESIWLDGDPVRLGQILSNLLNNAAKYTEPGGRIELEASRNDGIVQIVVRDNGIGIAPAALERIFDMFSRGDRSSTRSQGGLGIGLALARRLAQMHGGTIDARSAGAGAGSEFRVRLPISAHAPRKGEPGSRAPTQVLPTKRILVVDDNQDAAESLGALLGFLGADVRLAPDGPGGLGVFAEYDPALVFLDIGMPDMDGYEVASRIRKSFPERRPVLVALTGWGQAEDRRRAREAGFDHHLVKPAELAALQALLALHTPD